MRKLTSDLMLSPGANLQRDLAQGRTAMHETLQHLDGCPGCKTLGDTENAEVGFRHEGGNNLLLPTFPREQLQNVPSSNLIWPWKVAMFDR